MVDVFEKMADNANEFSRLLPLVCDALDADFEKLIRLSVLKVFERIVRRSPVDTGTYRASHGITTGEPLEGEGIRQGEYPEGGGEAGRSGRLAGEGWEEAKGWRWRLGDGVIYIYNNLPYAEKLEDGHSKQAPQGIYAVSFAELNTVFQEMLGEVPRLE